MSNNSSVNNARVTSDELSELRSLLLGIEPTKLNQLYERLENSQITAEEISRVLPEAVILRTIQDKQFSEAIVPTVEQSIHASIRKDLNVLAQIMFPIIGPATRKAVATVLEEMIQSMNKTLEHSLSPQSFKWRLEARQTGKSFAEVVLLRTLTYRVEQVFLIHKQTGLLLQHMMGLQVTVQDPDLVSAMLTAIRDFIRDSFSIQKEDALQTLEFGELTIWIEEGPQAIIAGIIRGNAPQELRLVFQEAIEKTHLRLGKELNAFQGETEPFVASSPYLELCLKSRYEVPAKKNYPYAWALLGTIAIACGIWSFFGIRDQLRWNTFLEKLNSQPGIVVVQVSKQRGKHFISGMRDPLAVDPNTLITQTNLNPKTIISQWRPYISLEPQCVTKRAEELLQPPKTVTFMNDNGILQVSGSAPHRWILSARNLWRFIPGITKFQDKNLIELELNQLELYKKQIEQEVLFFSEGTTQLLPGEDKKLQNLAIVLQKLLKAAQNSNQDVRLQILGHTTASGSQQTNTILSQARAHEILSYLTSTGMNKSYLNTIGMSFSQPLRSASAKDDESNRRVSFRVLLTNTSK
ncbi:MAG: OmpA family protein [Rhizonema sp. NSF051]|nr:OmpA family protein [Rhizonema sp. NSF051]